MPQKKIKLKLLCILFLYFFFWEKLLSEHQEMNVIFGIDERKINAFENKE
jgi:hypothetical protein